MVKNNGKKFELQRTMVKTFSTFCLETLFYLYLFFFGGGDKMSHATQF